MFILCPHCQFLVTLDAGGQPPAHCPSCDLAMIELPAQTPTPVADVPSTDAAVADAAEAQASVADVHAAEVPVSEVYEAEMPVAEEPHDAVPDVVAPGTDADVSAPSTADDAGTDSASEAPAAPTVIDTALPTLVAQPAETDAEPTVPSPPTETAPATQLAEPERPPTPASASRPRHARTAPSFARSRTSEGASARATHWKSVGAIAGLSLLLLLQLLLADRARLSADAQWRPALSMLCNVLRCRLPPWREPAAFSLLNREVRPHPGIPGVLRVTATFRNDARWPQPWPALLLTLSDVDGRAVGARVFDARDYLDASPTRTGLESGQSATIAMDVREPSPGIVAFTFDFR